MREKILALALTGAVTAATGASAVERPTDTSSYSQRPMVAISHRSLTPWMPLSKLYEQVAVSADKLDDYVGTYRVTPQLTFERDTSGKVTSLTLHQNGADMQALRIEPEKKG
jgi:hypothetical protein